MRQWLMTTDSLLDDEDGYWPQWGTVPQGASGHSHTVLLDQLVC
jgi:hypothetical protein